MRFQRGRKNRHLEYLDPEKQAAYDRERYGHRPDVIGSEFGNDQRCRRCGAPPGKQCKKADATYRNYPHQCRRDDATRWKGFVPSAP